MKYLFVFLFFFLFLACSRKTSMHGNESLLPEVVSEKVLDDSDDPAIWADHQNPEKSLVIGTDKHLQNGGLYVYNLQGKIDRERTKLGMKRVNNVDVAYGFVLGKDTVDIAVATERDRNCLRIFKLPEMKAIDGGGTLIMAQAADSLPMGIALYTTADHNIYAVVSRKQGPAENYLSQYLLSANKLGHVIAKEVRRFGNFSGKKEIESICVDNELGYIYYSDERAGIRKYYADPAKGNQELAFFGQGEYKVDNEGISIIKTAPGKGYLLVSNQSANSFIFYPREGSGNQPHQHPRLAEVKVSARESDGSDTWSSSLPGYDGGLFVAMSTNKTFHFYSLRKLMERAGLK